MTVKKKSKKKRKPPVTRLKRLQLITEQAKKDWKKQQKAKKS